MLEKMLSFPVIQQLKTLRSSSTSLYTARDPITCPRKWYVHSPGELCSPSPSSRRKYRRMRQRNFINQNDIGLQIIRFIGIILLAWLKDMFQCLIGKDQPNLNKYWAWQTNHDTSQTKQTRSGLGGRGKQTCQAPEPHHPRGHLRFRRHFLWRAGEMTCEWEDCPTGTDSADVRDEGTLSSEGCSSKSEN